MAEHLDVGLLPRIAETFLHEQGQVHLEEPLITAGTREFLCISRRPGCAYALAVASDHGVWMRGARAEARTLADALSAEARVRASAGARAQGPRWYDWACLALRYDAAVGWAHWLLVRRSVGDPTARLYRVHAPSGTAPGAMDRAVGWRRHSETAYADAQGLAGLDHDEVRRWEGWYRHVALSLPAHAALVESRAAATAAERGARTACSR